MIAGAPSPAAFGAPRPHLQTRQRVPAPRAHPGAPRPAPPKPQCPAPPRQHQRHRPRRNRPSTPHIPPHSQAPPRIQRHPYASVFTHEVPEEPRVVQEIFRRHPHAPRRRQVSARAVRHLKHLHPASPSPHVRRPRPRAPCPADSGTPPPREHPRPHRQARRTCHHPHPLHAAYIDHAAGTTPLVARIVLRIPPRPRQSVRTSSHAGFMAAARSSRIRFVTAS